MVDAERIAALLDRVRDEADHLQRLADREAALASDEIAMPAVKYRLIVAVEACIDAAEHIIASEGLRGSTDFADTFVVLAEEGVLDAELSAQMQDAARFRNLVVHQYGEVNNERIAAGLAADVRDLRAYVAAIADFVASAS